MNKDHIFLVCLGIFVILFFALIFGLTGLKVMVGVSFFLFLPIYLILNNFDLKTEEKVIFSIFLGFGIYSSLVYLLGRLFGSIRISMAVTFILLIIIAFLLKKLGNGFFSNNKKSSN